MSDEASSLSKHERGRLKKLLKRANAVDDDEGPLGGLLTVADWRELRELLHRQGKETSQQKVAAPVVGYRRGVARDRLVEASEHRDIFFRLLRGSEFSAAAVGDANGSPSRKRSRESTEELPRVPLWAHLHNPAAVTQMAVLELAPMRPDQLPALETLIEEAAATAQRTACRIPTRWFPGNQPKAMSSQLMCGQRPKPRRPPVSGPGIQTLQDLSAALSELVLTVEQWEKECYPRVELADSRAAEAVLESVRNDLAAVLPLLAAEEGGPRSIPHRHAAEVVRRAVSLVMSSSDDDVRLPPYVATLTDADTGRSARIFAMDCEMVRTTAGMELGRLSLLEVVTFTPETTETEVVLDVIVKPVNRVLDFLTAYSGITPKMFSDDAAWATLEQVQAALLATVGPNDIVVGHSLENDFQAARWVHPRVVDTAVLFRQERQSFKHSLRHLAATLLKIQIQTGDHCSEEDALATLQLAVRRAVEGPSFGIFNNRPVNRLAEVEGTVVCVGPSDWIKEYVTAQPNSIHALTCDDVHSPNCKAVASYLAGKARPARLVYAHWRVSDALKDLSAFASLLQDILTKASTSTVIMVALQPGFPEADKLSQLRRARLNPKSTLQWTDADEERRLSAVNACQQGTTYWITSRND